MEQERIFFDDIGSYPLPRGVKLDGLSRDRYLQLVGQVLAEKISAGVEIPTYPQLRDMIRMFMDPIKDPKMTESPFLIRREEAKIMELEAVPPGQKVRVCVTGPVELYISAFGATGYTDILYTLVTLIFFIPWRRAFPGSWNGQRKRERWPLPHWTSRAWA